MPVLAGSIFAAPFFTLQVHSFRAKWKWWTAKKQSLCLVRICWFDVFSFQSQQMSLSPNLLFLIRTDIFKLKALIHKQRELQVIQTNLLARKEENWVICHFSSFQRIPTCLGSLSSHRLLCRVSIHTNCSAKIFLTRLSFCNFWLQVHTVWVAKALLPQGGTSPLPSSNSKHQHV